MNEPQRVAAFTGTLYRVPKVCRRCAAEWEGNSFLPAPVDGLRVRYLCEICISKEEEAKRLLTEPVQDKLPVVDAAKPRKVREYDDTWEGY